MEKKEKNYQRRWDSPAGNLDCLYKFHSIDCCFVVDIFWSGPKWWTDQQTVWHCHHKNRLNLHVKMCTPDRRCFFFCLVYTLCTDVLRCIRLAVNVECLNSLSYDSLRKPHSPKQIIYSLHHGTKGRWPGVSRGELNLVTKNKTWLCFQKPIARSSNVIGSWAATGALKRR